ncbi:hypothetical protein KAR91_17440 [Candidatus Pacearchaeota archaeon]|nr:hypothetical protein [Candidatus Pacearchaeota archaeon]
MEYTEMSKEELIKEIEKLNKKLYQKKVSRLSWKKIMNDRLVKGPNYWSNGHFALYDTVPIPEAVNKLKSLYPSEIDSPLETIFNESDERKESDKTLWTDTEDGQTMTEHGVKFQKIYLAMLEKLIPGYTLRVAQDFVTALIYKDGELMGLLMPMKS